MAGPISGALGGWLSGDPTQQKSTGTTDSLDEMLKKLAELAKKRQAPGVGSIGVGGGGTGTTIGDPSGVGGMAGPPPMATATPTWMDQLRQLFGSA